MYIKSILLISSLVINLGTVSEISSEEPQISSANKTISAQLNDYYEEFKQPAAANNNCKCNLGTQNKSHTLANYYIDYLQSE